MRDRNRAVRILAKSVYKELSEQGYDTRQIVSFATELIGQVTEQLERERAAGRSAHEAKVRPARWPKRLGVRSTPPVGSVGLPELKLVGS